LIENIVQDAATTFIMVTIRTELPSVGHVQPVRSYGVFVLVILRVRPISIKSVFVRRIVGMRKVAAITLLIQPNFRRLDTGNKITLWRRDLTSTNTIKYAMPHVEQALIALPIRCADPSSLRWKSDVVRHRHTFTGRCMQCWPFWKL